MLVPSVSRQTAQSVPLGAIARRTGLGNELPAIAWAADNPPVVGSLR